MEKEQKNGTPRYTLQEYKSALCHHMRLELSNPTLGTDAAIRHYRQWGTSSREPLDLSPMHTHANEPPVTCFREHIIRVEGYIFEE